MSKKERETNENTYEIKDWERLCDPQNWHPAANMFPMLGDDEGFRLKDLVANIKQEKLLNPVTMLDGKVLDGRNRLAACKIAGVTPKFINWDGTGGSPEAWVVSQNSSRRDVTPSQKAYASLYLRKTLKPTKEQKDKFTEGGGKWDFRIYACNLLGIDRHYYSDIAAIEKWANMESSDRWPTPPSKPHPELLEDIKSGLHGIASTVRKIEFWIAQANDPTITEQEIKECPTGQLASEFVALIPKHIMEKAYMEASRWLKGEKLIRLKRYWERMDKEYTWNHDES
jgi:hypothetical protein